MTEILVDRDEAIEAIEKLRELKAEMARLADEALGVIRETFGRSEVERSRAYWYGHLTAALDNECEHGNRYDTTLATIIGECERRINGDEDEFSDDEGDD